MCHNTDGKGVVLLVARLVCSPTTLNDVIRTGCRFENWPNSEAKVSPQQHAKYPSTAGNS